jgi:hypothetical protein
MAVDSARPILDARIGERRTFSQIDVDFRTSIAIARALLFSDSTAEWTNGWHSSKGGGVSFDLANLFSQLTDWQKNKA